MKLGPSRATKENQHDYLVKIAAEFQDITSCALKAHYGEHDIFDSDFGLMKLATTVVTRNTAFSDDVALRGHTLKFDNSYTNESTEETKTEATRPKLPEWMKSRTSVDRYFSDNSDTEHCLPRPITVRNPQETNIISWLESLYIGSRGFELGSFDPSLLTMIWRKQSANWDNLAIGYICDIVNLVHGAVRRILSHCCRNERVGRRLVSLLIEPLLERYKKAIDHVKFILEVERAGTPFTANHYFADNLEKWYVTYVHTCEYQ